MTFTNLPRPLALLLSAIRERNLAVLSGVFAEDAVVLDHGRRHEGRASIQAWADGLLGDASARLHPIDVLTRDAVTTVTFSVLHRRDDPENLEPAQLEWKLGLRNEQITSLLVEDAPGPNLPQPVASFVQAMNAFDLEKLLHTFSEDALVNDQLRPWWGRDAIREWATRDIIGDRVTMHVVEAVSHYEACIVTANVDGDFDKRGLPDPFVMTFYFSTFQGQLVRLIILRAQV